MPRKKHTPLRGLSRKDIDAAPVAREPREADEEGIRRACGLIIRPWHDAVGGLTGEPSRPGERSDWWRLTFELSKATGCCVHPRDLANMPAPEIVKMLQAAAKMKRQQRAHLADHLVTIRIPMPGSRPHSILKAMHALKAFDESSRRPAAVIVAATGNYSEPATFKKTFARLRAEGMVCSTRGKHGGYWLTDLGRIIAEHL